jgi:hypothetical protein
VWEQGDARSSAGDVGEGGVGSVEEEEARVKEMDKMKRID